MTTTPALKKWHAESILTFTSHSLRGWLEALDDTIRWEAGDAYTVALRDAVATRLAFLDRQDVTASADAELADAAAEVDRLKSELGDAEARVRRASRRAFDAGIAYREATAAWVAIQDDVLDASGLREDEPEAVPASTPVFAEGERVIVVDESGYVAKAGRIRRAATPDDSRAVVDLDNGEQAWAQPWSLVGESHEAFEVIADYGKGAILYGPATLNRARGYVQHDAPGMGARVRRISARLAEEARA